MDLASPKNIIVDHENVEKDFLKIEDNRNSIMDPDPEEILRNLQSLQSPVIDYDAPPPNCVPKKRFFFLKTHKTASSVIENIVFRYGKNHNKTFAVPKDGGLVFKYTVPFSKTMVKPLRDEKEPEILSQHLKWSSDADQMFPSGDSFRFTIVRDPKTLFGSLFNYFKNINPVFHRAPSADDFIKDPWFYIGTKKQVHFTTRNSMAFQMGHNSFVEQEPTQAEIDDILSRMDDQFDLILIADHLPESLVLLRHELCLSINEITSLSKNVAKRKHSNDDMKQKISEWETIDQPIFEKANASLWSKIEQFGTEKMNKELELLKKRNEDLASECVEAYKPVKQLSPEFQDYEPPGVRIEGIKLKPDVKKVCTDIALAPFAHAIDILDNQCQDSTFLRNFMHMKSWPKSTPKWCS